MKEEATFELPLRVFEDAAELFGLLSTPDRLRIVNELCSGEKNVAELLAHVHVTQPNMSQHLTTLYRSGLVAKRRRGAQVYFRIADDAAELVCVVLHSQLAGDGEHDCVGAPVQYVVEWAWP